MNTSILILIYIMLHPITKRLEDLSEPIDVKLEWLMLRDSILVVQVHSFMDQMILIMQIFKGGILPQLGLLFAAHHLCLETLNPIIDLQ